MAARTRSRRRAGSRCVKSRRPFGLSVGVFMCAAPRSRPTTPRSTATGVYVARHSHCWRRSPTRRRRPRTADRSHRTSHIHTGGRMIVVTTPTMEGRRISKYLGLVTGDAILGANIFRDLFAGIRDIVGGRSAAYEKELRTAKRIALVEMMDEATGLGANAVVGVDLDYETIEMGSGGGMLMVSASGTAVFVEE